MKLILYLHILSCSLRIALSLHPDEPGSPTGCQAQVAFARPLQLLAGMMGRLGGRGDGIPATLALFRLPQAVILDRQTEQLYVSDAGNHVVRMISIGTGMIHTIAGVLEKAGAVGEDGQATSALLREPHGLAMDFARNRLLIADQGNHAVRAVDLIDGNISTLAGTLGVPGELKRPAGLSSHSIMPDLLFIADQGNSAIRVMNLSSLVFKTVEAAGLKSPAGLAFDPLMHKLYVADKERHVIWKLDLGSLELAEVDIVESSTTVIAGHLDTMAEMGTSVWDNWEGQQRLNLVTAITAVSAARSFKSDMFPSKGLVGYKDGQPYGPGSGMEQWELDEQLAAQSARHYEITRKGAWESRPARTISSRYYIPGVEVKLKEPHGLTLDPIGQRLYIADAAAPAVRMLDLTTTNISRIISMPGYYGQHYSSKFAVGPVGVYVDVANISGFMVAHNEYTIYRQSTFGKYFYFDKTVLPYIEGVQTVQQYRNSVMIWRGHVEFRDGVQLIGPSGFQQDCMVCNAQGLRWPGSEAEEGQFEVGDLLHIQSLHPQTTQRIFTAEGNNFAVRVADIANPYAGLICPAHEEQPDPLYSPYMNF